jgi:formylglycine-generating enzyme
LNCSGNIHKYPDKYSCPGYRLPTSAEWEYAAKAGTETHTYAGDLLTEIPQDQRHLECPSQPVVNDIGWYCYNSGGEAQDVAQKQPNPWGLYDMLGNVAELVDYHFNGGKSLLDDHPDQGETLINPTGPVTGVNIEFRGRYFNSAGCT